MSEHRRGNRDEPWWVRWTRRALTIPLYVALLAVYVCIAPVVLPAFALYDAARKSRFAATRTVAFFGWYLVCEVAGLLAAAVLWLAYRCLPWVDLERFRR